MGPLLLLSAASLPPVEQCGGDPTFDAFRTELAQVVRRRDSGRLLAMLDEEALVDLGGGTGRKAFADNWELAGKNQSRVWTHLDRMLPLGCALAGDARVIPSMVVQIDPSIDAYETVVAVTADAAMRSAPQESAEVVARLNWDLLTVGAEDIHAEWMPVSLSDGRRGFVRREHVRSPIDFRMAIENKGQGWRITAFVAGD